MPQITVFQLKEWARQPDVELYVEGGKRQGDISVRTGSFGGRIVQTLSVDRQGPEAMEYEQAKRQVRDALCDIYGEQRGDQAFRAGIGHVNERGQHIWDTNQPLTGRDIAKMIKFAEPEAELDEFLMRDITTLAPDRSEVPDSQGDRSIHQGPRPPDVQIKSVGQPSEKETSHKTVEQRKLEETKRKHPWANHIEISHEEFYSDPEKYVNRQQTVEVRVQPAERMQSERPGSNFPSEEIIEKQRDRPGHKVFEGAPTDFHSVHHISVSGRSVDVQFSSNIPFEYLRVRHQDKEIVFRPPKKDI